MIEFHFEVKSLCYTQPPVLPLDIPISSAWYRNRGTHDYSLARGNVSSGTLTNGLRIANSGTGFQYWWGGDTPDSDNWGTLELINLVEKVAREWRRLYPDYPLITSMDMSRQSGGYFGGNPPHTSHQNGLDVDVRYIRKDGYSSGVTTNSSNYSRTRTQELINLFFKFGNIIVIYSADTELQGITYEADHNDHFHVRIADPDGNN